MTETQQAAGLPDGINREQASPVGLFTRVRFGMVRAFLVAWVRCFSLSGLHRFGQAFATVEWVLDARRRRRFRKRVEATIGQKLDRRQIRQIVLQYFRRVRCDKIIYLIIDRLPRDEIMGRITFHGREHLEAALSRGQGVYIAMAHTGSHHVAGLLMALSGYKTAGVRDRHESVSRRYIQHVYAETFPEFRDIKIFFSDAFPRDLYRCFRENYVLGTALDADRVRGMTLKTLPVRLFGQQREFLTGTMQIALRCGATILQGFLVSGGDYTFHVHLSEPLIDPDQGKDEPAVLAEVMQRYADGIEAHVREYPCHLSKLY